MSDDKTPATGGSGGETYESADAGINLSEDRKGMVLMPDQSPPQIDPVAHMDGTPQPTAQAEPSPAPAADQGSSGADSA